MALTPIIVFHDRHKLVQDEKDWAYVSDCTVLWVDEEDLMDSEDNVKTTDKFDKTMILDKKPLMDLVLEKPKKNNGGFFV